MQQIIKTIITLITIQPSRITAKRNNMLANIDIIKNFEAGINSHNRNLESRGTRLINYSTCIAQFYNNKLYINITKYSVSTSKIQSLVRWWFDGYKDVIFIKGVPINSAYLVSNV